jgi:ankyrin repeat protein
MKEKSAAKKLISAIKRGKVAAAQAAIAERPDYSELVQQVTPLHWAIHHKQYDIAQSMLEAGAPADSRNGMDETPLMFCAAVRTDQLPDEEAVRYARLLLSHGASVAPRSANGYIHLPLTIARLRKKLRLAELLEEHGARTFDVTLTMLQDNGTPLSTRFYYGPPWASSFAAGESDSSGHLKLESVLEGQLVIGFLQNRDVKQESIIGTDGTANPDSLTWPTM